MGSDTSGARVYASDATAGILTLPAAKAGYEVEIFIAASQTGDTHITVPSGYFIGGLHVIDPATAGDTNFFLSDGNSNDFINLDSDAKGRLAGGLIRIVCDGTNCTFLDRSLVTEPWLLHSLTLSRKLTG